MRQPATIQRTILLVEDDDETRRLYGILLRAAGFAVIEAANGPDAVRAALDEPPDLILMDMNLPVLDGWEAARLIRSDARAGAIPLLAFSATVDSTADLRRDVILFDGFIAKPVSPAELVRRVSAYVDLVAPVRKRGDSPRPTPARRESSGRGPRAGTAWQ